MQLAAVRESWTAERFAKELFWQARRKLRLTPFCGVMRELRRRGVDPSSLQALEVFGHVGKMVTVDYASAVAGLEVWEIEQQFETELRRNVPQACVRIVDSYVQLRLTTRKFGLVVVDNGAMCGKHYEHFGVFPDVFRVLEDFAVLILNVVPEVYVQDAMTSEHHRRRQDFYERDPNHVPLEEMIRVYRRLANTSGFHVRWWFIKDRYFLPSLRHQSRKKRLCFLVLALQRAGIVTERGEGSGTDL